MRREYMERKIRIRTAYIIIIILYVVVCVVEFSVCIYNGGNTFTIRKRFFFIFFLSVRRTHTSDIGLSKNPRKLLKRKNFP